MPVTHLFAAIPVADYDRSLAWYERLFARPPDRVPNDNEAVWQVAETGLVYVIRDEARAGKTVLTLIVDDLERQLGELTERELVADEIVELPGAGRKAAIHDPEGNRIAFAELNR